MPTDHFRFHRSHERLSSPFGGGAFGSIAEQIAHLFGTPQYLAGQTGIVVLWMLLNAVGVVHFDLYPFILLNLAFSLQAAYAAPLILLAQTRQAARDKAMTEADARHREELSEQLLRLLEQNTELTQQVEHLTQEIHTKVV